MNMLAECKACGDHQGFSVYHLSSNNLESFTFPACEDCILNSCSWLLEWGEKKRAVSRLSFFLIKSALFDVTREVASSLMNSLLSMEKY